MRHTGVRSLRRRSRRNAGRGSLAMAIAAVAALLSTPHAAAAQPRSADAGVSPIRIERCAVLSRSVLQDPFNGLRVEFVSGIAVRFSNVGRIPVASVSLTFGYQGSSRTVVDRGTFAPGASIDRTYATFAGMTSGSDAAMCRVVSVLFADGTAWTNAHAGGLSGGSDVTP